MTFDDELQQRFGRAKSALTLDTGSVDEIKRRSNRNARRNRLVMSVTSVAVIAMLGWLVVRTTADDPDQLVVATEPGEEAVVTGTPGSVSLPNGVIFETDFSQDAGYRVGFTNLWNGGDSDPVDPPHGWDGVRVGPGSEIAVVAGEGINGSNAARLSWGGAAQPGLSLGKHLTGDESTGFDELYIRYRVRLPDGIRFGSGDGNLGAWSWARLWQNTSVEIDGPNGWTEQRPNSGHAGFLFNNGIPYTSATSIWAENPSDAISEDGGGRPQQRVDWFVEGSEPDAQIGYFESIWDINTTDRAGELEDNTGQGWHSIEVRFALASSDTSDDGVFEVYVDGESQGPPTVIAPMNGAPNRSGIPTTRLGSGFNFFTFFEHITMWNAQWDDPGVDGYIWVNDVVVSGERIGPDYSPTQ